MRGDSPMTGAADASAPHEGEVSIDGAVVTAIEGASFPRLPPISAAALRAARGLRRCDGVRGIFWGLPRRGGEWLNAPTLCVHVLEKQPLSRLAWPVPKAFEGFQTDVIDAGSAVCQSVLDTTDSVSKGGVHARRRSSITAIAAIDDVVHAILSGHGTMPIEQGRIRRRGIFGAEEESFLVQDTGGRPFSGQLLRGAIEPDRDFALARFPGLAVERTQQGHMLAPAPVPVRSEALAFGERVEHFGTVRRQAFSGSIVQSNVSSEGVTLTMPDGSRIGYTGILAIAPDIDQEPFSIAGESGSLVFDRQRRAIGVLVGGTSDGSLSYVQDVFPALRHELGAMFGRFFEES